MYNHNNNDNFLLIIKAVKKKIITDDQLVSNIKRFIHGNLNRATLKMLEVEFNLDYYEINSLNKDFKPAQFIKKERSELATRTVYSETYLLKNKYKFLR